MLKSFRGFSVRAVLAAIAIIAINLAAARATSRHYPRPRIFPTTIAMGHQVFVNGEDGGYIVYKRDMRTGRRYDPQVIRPPLPSLLRVWSPVIGSTTLTLVVLVLLGVRRRRS